MQFCWIPSHVGIRGNEIADAAARRAASLPCTRLWDLGFRVLEERGTRRLLYTGCVQVIRMYAAHGYLLRGEERPACPHCSIPLTVDHVLLKCPRFSVSRRRHFEYITPTVTLRHLLGHASKRIQTGSFFSYVLDIKFPVVYSSH